MGRPPTRSECGGAQWGGPPRACHRVRHYRMCSVLELIAMWTLCPVSPWRHAGPCRANERERAEYERTLRLLRLQREPCTSEVHWQLLAPLQRAREACAKHQQSACGARCSLSGSGCRRGRWRCQRCGADRRRRLPFPPCAPCVVREPCTSEMHWSFFFLPLLLYDLSSSLFPSPLPAPGRGWPSSPEESATLSSSLKRWLCTRRERKPCTSEVHCQRCTSEVH